MTPDTRDYIGRCPKCGGITAALCYAFANAEHVGDFHRRMLESGRIFDRATKDEIKASFAHVEGCELKPRKETQKAMF